MLNLHSSFPQVASYLLMLAALISFYSLIVVTSTDQLFLVEFNLTVLNSASFSLPVILDKTSCAVSFTVLLISSSVLWFTSSYLSEDVNLDRFTLLVVAFVIAINCLVFIPNLATLLLGWDGLGVTSFVLVIYYQNGKSLAAGIITALSNRIGDALLIVSIALLVSSGDWNILSLSQHYIPSAIAFMIMVAAITKSAQMPFSSWLPAAIAAPTPVSALVHSSTLVTAGVFLLIRFHYSLVNIPGFSVSLFMIGVTTSLIAGTSACLETDLKKIIALSTLSQLGLMMMSLGLSLSGFALFHLLTHALFNALLFLCAGTIIHVQQNNQDIRLMGNLSNQLPLTTSVLNMANLALCGFPFLGGFYSNDLILENSSNVWVSALLLTFMWLSVGLTTLYSVRLSAILLWNPNNGAPLTSLHEEETPLVYPMCVLALGAITGGAFFSWLLTPSLMGETLPLTTKILPLGLTVISFILGMKLTSPSLLHVLTPSSSVIHSVSSMWFLTPLSSTPLTKGLFLTAKVAQQSGEGGWQEVVGGQGALFLSNSLMSVVQQGQKNPVSIILLLVGTSIGITLLIV